MRQRARQIGAQRPRAASAEDGLLGVIETDIDPSAVQRQGKEAALGLGVIAARRGRGADARALDRGQNRCARPADHQCHARGAVPVARDGRDAHVSDALRLPGLGPAVGAQPLGGAPSRLVSGERHRHAARHAHRDVNLRDQLAWPVRAKSDSEPPAQSDALA